MPSGGELRDYFNKYVDEIFPSRKAASGGRLLWPGDEWSPPGMRERVFVTFFGDQDLTAWRRAVEIGAGAGSYTEILLARSRCAVRAYDVSERFLEVLGERCAPAAAEGRLACRLIDWKKNGDFLEDLKAAGWLRSIDAFVGIDVFIHLDLQSLVVYLLTAALALRPEGKLVGTFANLSSSGSMEQLFADIKRCPAFGTGLTARFHWLTDEMLERVLARLGFRIDKRIDGMSPDLQPARTYLVATLVDPAPGEALRAQLE